MSFAIQCLQENIIGAGGYVDEIEIYNRIKCDQSIIFEAFGELIHNSLLSKEYYENKGHKVLGRFIGNTNSFEINPKVKNDKYETSYFIEFKKTICVENKKYILKLFNQIFVGDYEASLEHANKLKEILSKEPDFPTIEYTIVEHKNKERNKK